MKVWGGGREVMGGIRGRFKGGEKAEGLRVGKGLRVVKGKG